MELTNEMLLLLSRLFQSKPENEFVDHSTDDLQTELSLGKQNLMQAKQSDLQRMMRIEEELKRRRMREGQ